MADLVPLELKKYIYTDQKVYCCNIDLAPMYDNIEPYDYIKPIKTLANYYKSAVPNYYDQLYMKYKDVQLDKPIIIKDYDYDMDEILLQYVKCIKHSSLLIVWPIANIKSIVETEFYNELLNNGVIHGIKELNLSSKQVQGVIYQVYYDKSGFKDFQSIKGKQKNSNGDQFKNKFFIILYEANNFSELSGKDAPLKIKLRELLRKNSNKSQDTKPNFFLHVTDNHTHVVELAQLFFNKNSMRLLEYQRLDRLLIKDFSSSLRLFMTLKNWLYQNITLVDQMRFLFFSSIVIYTLGMRNMNDIDLLIYENDSNNKIHDMVKKFFIDSSTKFPFVDVSYKKDNKWYAGDIEKENQAWFEQEWPNMYDAKSMDETFFNPKYHYYYFGIKIISLIADIKRRIERSRAAAYADLVALIKLANQEIKIPPMPKGYWKRHVYYDYTDKEKFVQYKKIAFYLKQRYNIFMKTDEIKKIIPETGS